MNVIKICGLRDLESALVAASSGADLLGFIFAPSRRQVDAAQVADIVGGLRNAGYTVPTVGVFVDPEPDQLLLDISASGIDFIQLSGEESPDILELIPVPVIKAIPVGDADDELSIRCICDTWSSARYFHIDASDPSARGGTGKLANWAVAASLARHIPVVLAGGLDPDNVTRAIRDVRPLGVDVSSGVETNGAKDSVKIAKFIETARTAFSSGRGR